MIALSDYLQAALAGMAQESFSTVQVGDYKTTSYFRNLTLSDGSTYIADGNLMGVDAPSANSAVTKDLFSIQLADPAFFSGLHAEGNLVGLRMEVRLGFVEQSTGAPITDLADMLLVYRGRVGGGAYQIDTQAVGSSIFNITGGNPMSDLDHTRPYWTNDTFLREINPDDTSFESNAEGSGTLILGWGKR